MSDTQALTSAPVPTATTTTTAVATNNQQSTASTGDDGKRIIESQSTENSKRAKRAPVLVQVPQPAISSSSTTSLPSQNPSYMKVGENILLPALGNVKSSQQLSSMTMQPEEYQQQYHAHPTSSSPSQFQHPRQQRSMFDEEEEDDDGQIDEQVASRSRLTCQQMLNPGDIEWDASTLTDDVGPPNPFDTTIHWQDGMDGHNKTRRDYFHLMYPCSSIEETIKTTSANLRNRGLEPLTKQEFFVFVALVGTVSLNKQVEGHGAFFDPAMGRLTLPVPQLGAFMARPRFQAILDSLAFHYQPQHQPRRQHHHQGDGGVNGNANEDINGDDANGNTNGDGANGDDANGDTNGNGEREDETIPPSRFFDEVKPLVDAFNTRRGEVVTPGTTLTVSSFSSLWTNQQRLFARSAGMTLLGSGYKVNHICDGESGVVVRLSVEKEMDEPKISSQSDRVDFSVETDSILRLASPFESSKRVIIAKDAFASLDTAVRLFQRDLFFIGIVDGQATLFPSLPPALTQPMYANATHVPVTCKWHGVPMICWYDRKQKAYLSTTGTTSLDEGRTKQNKSVFRPMIRNHYFSKAFPLIRVSTFCTETLAFASNFNSLNPRIHFFCSILAIVMADAYSAFIHEHPHVPETIVSFASKTLLELIMAHSGTAKGVILKATAQQGLASVCELVPLRQAPCYATTKEPKKQCAVCSKRCKTYCPQCTQDDTNRKAIVALCTRQTGRTCFSIYHSKF
eukprot:m.30163 g.30163  ORF g.30163 m.30163 type:complete len:738 (+) comp6210_c0_seq1:253-2466(+)